MDPHVHPTYTEKSPLIGNEDNNCETKDTIMESTREPPHHPYWFQCITVEPIIMLFSFAMNLTSPVVTTLYLTQTCHSMGFNETACLQLEENTSTIELETVVQPAANLLKMYAALIETMLPAVLTLFIGSWSDLYGRKTFMLAPMFGYGLKYFICLWISHNPALPGEFLLLSSVPVGLSGGMTSVLSMCYCHVGDVSDRRSRGFRLGIVEASFHTGMLLGSAVGSLVFAEGKYLLVFSLGSLLCLLGLLYGLCWLKESVTILRDSGVYCSLFQLRFVREILSVCWNQKHRAVILMSITVLGLTILMIVGEDSVKYLFTREKFAWDIQQYLRYSSINLILDIIGTVTAVATLSKWLGWSDDVISCGSFVLVAIGAIVLAISPTATWMYIGSFVAMFGSVAGPLVRSMVSKSVDPKDLGKMFSLVGFVEALTPVAASPLYALVYNSTISIFPGAFYLLSCGFHIINMILLSVVISFRRR